MTLQEKDPYVEYVESLKPGAFSSSGTWYVHGKPGILYSPLLAQFHVTLTRDPLFGVVAESSSAELRDDNPSPRNEIGPSGKGLPRT